MMPMLMAGAPKSVSQDHQPSPRKVEVLFKLVAPGSFGKSAPSEDEAHHRVSLLPVLCRPSHRNRDLRTTEATASRKSGYARRLPSRVPHNATDEGSKKNPHQSRLSALLLVFWLTSAIYRIFKELDQATSLFYVANSPKVRSSWAAFLFYVAASPKVQTFIRFWATSHFDVATSSKRHPSHRYHRPVQAASRHLAPAGCFSLASA
jgi:hypothetical protein